MNMNISGEFVKGLRLQRGWTQEHLASLVGCNVRTIQRVETKGICGIETKSALAAVFEVDAKKLNGEEKIEQAKADGDNGPLFYQRTLTGQAIIDVFAGTHWYRFSNETPKTEEDADAIAETVDFIHDYSEAWDDIDPGAKVKATFAFNQFLKDLEERGFWLFGLRTKSKVTFPVQDGNGTTMEVKIANFHVAYANSKDIIVLDPQRGQ